MFPAGKEGLIRTKSSLDPRERSCVLLPRENLQLDRKIQDIFMGTKIQKVPGSQEKPPGIITIHSCSKSRL